MNSCQQRQEMKSAVQMRSSVADWNREISEPRLQKQIIIGGSRKISRFLSSAGKESLLSSPVTDDLKNKYNDDQTSEGKKDNSIVILYLFL